MNILPKTEHLKRYKDILRLLLKYGRSDLVKQASTEDIFGEELTSTSAGVQEAHDLAADLEKLGPTFVKLGQLLSSRPELFPPVYLEAFARLQDQVEPFPFADVERIVAEELGLRLSKAFSEFDPVPIAAASLGQVHRALMRDGRPVAVKVQRPGIRKEIFEDLEVLQQVTDFIDKHTEIGTRFSFPEMHDEFRKTLLRELDYRQEARNLTLLRKNLESFPKILVPNPIQDYTTSLVLTMEYVPGKKVTSVGPLARIDLNGAELDEQLFGAYLQQILVDGFFHADPHPGNVFLTDDGRIALLDLGMVGRIAPRLREQLLQLILAISEGRGEETAVAAIKIGKPLKQFDETSFVRKVSDLVADHQDVNMADLHVGKTIMNLARISADCSIRMPPELTLLGKALVNLDQVGSILDPQFDPNACIRRNAAEIMRKSMLNSVSPANLFGGMIELKTFAEQLPGRINKIIDAAANNELRLHVDAIDEVKLIEGLHNIANRITLGLILAALIISAAMLMRVETSFHLLGYPGFAILFFLAAACGGCALVISILLDQKPKDRN